MNRFWKTILKVIGIIVMVLVLAIGVLAAYIQWFDHPKYEIEQIVKLDLQGCSPETGRKIVSNMCVSCHLTKDGNLSGKVLMDHPQWGVVRTGNLTLDPASHISRYTDEQLYYFLKTGIKPEGRMALPMMPKFATMSHEDMCSVIAFLRSDNEMTKATRSTQLGSEPSFFLKALMKFEIKPVRFNLVDEMPDPSNAQAYGSYLVNGRYSCFECHSRSTAKINYLDPPSSYGYLGGGSSLLVYGNDIGIRSANITPDNQHGIGAWSFDDFKTAITTGVRPDGMNLRAPMNHMTMDSTEITAIWAYLQTVEPQTYEWPYSERMEYPDGDDQ